MYLETHCNIGSKRVFTTSVLDRWHSAHLLTHKLFSSCIRRYLVSRACDWVMPALSAVLLTFSFQFNVLFFNMSLTTPYKICGSKPHQHCSVLLDNIRQRTLIKIWVSSFLVRSVHTKVKTLTLKVETRHPIGGGGIWPWVFCICNHCGVMKAWSRKTWKFWEQFLRFFYQKRPLSNCR